MHEQRLPNKRGASGTPCGTPRKYSCPLCLQTVHLLFAAKLLTSVTPFQNKLFHWHYCEDLPRKLGRMHVSVRIDRDRAQFSQRWHQNSGVKKKIFFKTRFQWTLHVTLYLPTRMWHTQMPARETIAPLFTAEHHSRYASSYSTRGAYLWRALHQSHGPLRQSIRVELQLRPTCSSPSSPLQATIQAFLIDTPCGDNWWTPCHHITFCTLQLEAAWLGLSWQNPYLVIVKV